MIECKICNSTVDELMDFGEMPIANGFLERDQFEDEFFYNLRLGICERCRMVQLINTVPPEKLFHEDRIVDQPNSRNMLKPQVGG